MVISSQLSFRALVQVCGKLATTTGIDAESIESLIGIETEEFKTVAAAAGKAEEARNVMVHASWVPERDGRSSPIGRDAGTIERERIPRRSARRQRTIIDLKQVEDATAACDRARDLLGTFIKFHFPHLWD